MTLPIRLLSQGDIAKLMRPSDYLEAVEAGFRAAKAGRADSPPPMHIHGQGGAFHAKGASYDNGRAYAALKLNGNFPGNPQTNGLPTIQGAILLADAANGSLLAILDSAEVTLQRTAAATALAAHHLARPDSSTVCLVGCGGQALPHLTALLGVLPLQRCLAFDLDPGKAGAFASEALEAFDIDCDVAGDLHQAALLADVIVTVTSARAPVLGVEEVKPGTFIAAVGTDSPDKNEIAPALMAASIVVVDVLDQCLAMGDLRHAIAAGAMTEAEVHADLGDVVVGKARGRDRDDQTIVFDSTGTALEDVASAALIYERAVEAGAGTEIMLAQS
ncbi:MAG TPA: ornithine cyclodeaminase family protein [Sphingomicrobium sp.]|nr:ornithine cyclodeaminase family protein [Sphingomicrobium sp.]